MKKIFSILTVAVIAFAFTSCGGGSDTPEKVAEKFLNHVAKSEFKDAKSLATGEAVKTIETLESLSSMGGEKPEVKDIKIEDMKCDTKEDAANCTYKKDGKEGTIDLTKVDGKWKVSNYPKEMGGEEGLEADTETTEETAEATEADDVTEEEAK